MTDDAGVSTGSVAVDAAIRAWRQGDCVRGEHWFLFRSAPDSGGAAASTSATAENDVTSEMPVAGFVVVTQSCDIARASSDRPFVEVCPLVEIELSALSQVKLARTPRHAFIPALEDLRLVADLDRTMTVTKSVLATWHRIQGCVSDDDARAFAEALARKRRRFAFPDEFSRLAEPLRERLQGKHQKQSPEGDALRALREIRVTAEPSWDAARIVLTFWFVIGEDGAGASNAQQHLEKWLALVPPCGDFVEVHGQLVALEDMTAADYVHSDPLDLDHLSAQTPTRPDPA